MKQIVILAIGVIATSQAGLASLACGSGTVASYIALGSSGCTIGGDKLNNFQALTGINFSQPLDPTLITVTPGGSAFSPKLTLNLNATAQSSILEGLFTYRISGSNFTGDTITLSGTSATGNGVVTDIQNFCGGGMFGPDGVSGCTGNGGTLIALGNGSFGATFAGTPFLNVTHDFTLDPGGSGTATGGQIVDQFTGTATPEPKSLGLVGLGLLVAVYLTNKGARN